MRSLSCLENCFVALQFFCSSLYHIVIDENDADRFCLTNMKYLPIVFFFLTFSSTGLLLVESA